MPRKPRAQNNQPIDLRQVEILASRGLTHAQIAAVLGISEKTLYKRKNESSEIAEAINRGKAKGIAEISNALYESAKKGNTTAQVFFLKAQGGWKDNRIELTTTQPVHVTFSNDLKD